MLLMTLDSYDDNAADAVADIDECALTATNPCQQRCINSPGSLRCACDVPGFVLSNDGFSCEGKLTSLLHFRQTSGGTSCTV